MDKVLEQASELGLQVGTMILGALLLYVVGRAVISGVMRVVHGMLTKRLEGTVAGYLESATRILLNVLLAIAILSIFGVETTTFAGLLAAAGVAVGMAWSGLLSNFAAGVFLLVLRPFRSGDFVTVGGVTGTVEEIGMFVTSLDTPANVRTFVGNAKVLGDVIENYSANDFRRVDLVAQLDHNADVDAAVEALRRAVRKIPNVVEVPGVDVEVLEFTARGPVLAVRPYTHTDHYWDVYFATNKTIRVVLSELGFEPARERFDVRSGAS